MTALTPRRQAFRDAMARFPSAVSVVTTAGPAGRCGLTASSVSAATDDPPTLIVCINRLSRTNVLFKANGMMAVNVLAAGQEELAVRFSSQRSRAELFPDDAWSTLQTGSPVLNHALVAFDGRIVEVKEIGTHTAFIVEVDASAGDPEARGLVYFGRRYISMD